MWDISTIQSIYSILGELMDVDDPPSSEDEYYCDGDDLDKLAASGEKDVASFIDDHLKRLANNATKL